jgi:hypothetical protein
VHLRNMRPLPAFPLDADPIDPPEILPENVLEYSSDHLEDDPDDRPTLHSRRSFAAEKDAVRPPMKSGVVLTTSLDDLSFGERADLEWRLYHRGRFAAEHHKLNVLTLRRLDAMYERLTVSCPTQTRPPSSCPTQTRPPSLEEATNIVRAAFLTDDERRAALVPLLTILYPLAYFDEQMPTPDVVRLIAHAEVRRPAQRLA